MRIVKKKFWLPTAFLQWVDEDNDVHSDIKLIYDPELNQLDVIEMDAQGYAKKSYRTTLEEFEQKYSVELNELRNERKG